MAYVLNTMRLHSQGADYQLSKGCVLLLCSEVPYSVAEGLDGALDVLVCMG